MEGPHGQLGPGFANGLRGDDSYGLADIDDLSCSKIAAVAFDTDTVAGAAGKYRTKTNFGNTELNNLLGNILIDHLIPIHKHLSAIGMIDRLQGKAADDPLDSLLQISAVSKIFT